MINCDDLVDGNVGGIRVRLYLFESPAKANPAQAVLRSSPGPCTAAVQASAEPRA